MRVLTDHEILAVAGGLPPGISLDEVLYRAPAEALRDPMACAALAAEEHPTATNL